MNVFWLPQHQSERLPAYGCCAQVSEDEVYELQFGESFAAQALNPLAGSIDRDDFALGIANMDE